MDQGTKPKIQPAFSAGEVGPALFGRTDIAKLHVGLATCRNAFVSYRGGAYSRAGSEFVGYSKQTGRAYPPRLISFQFSINQGIALEFGNFYMRPIVNGGFVLEPALAVIGASQASPCVITIASYSVSSATPINGIVTASYAPGEVITLAGGVFSVAGQLTVIDTLLLSTAVNNPGNTTLGGSYLGYVPGDTITLSGGIDTVPPQVIVQTTKVIAAAAADFAPGTGGTPGSATVTGTTGTGTKFQASVTIGVGGGITAVNSISLAGSYTANPTFTGYPYYAYVEPVTGGGLSGAKLVIQMGVATVSVLNPGLFTTNAVGGAFTQQLTSGGGAGATFSGSVFGPAAVSVTQGGVYTTAPTNPVLQGSSSGTGLGAEFNVAFSSGSLFNAGDWVFLQGIGGMTQLNGRTVVVTPLGSNQYSLYDVFGSPIDSTAYGAFSGNGSIARLYTLQTPWGEQDLPWLKFTQSADDLSLCCVNQKTLTEYSPFDISRNSYSNWSVTVLNTTPSVSPPASAGATASSSGSIYYQYVVTAVNPADGTESVASPIANVANAVNITATAGSITVTWSQVSGVNEYNIYKAMPGYNAPPPPGALFGFAGSAYGTQFIDLNIVADDAQVPPLHQNPFSRGQITGLSIVSGGSEIATISYSIATVNGTGAEIDLILVGNQLVGYIVQDPGQNYQPGDIISFLGTAVSGQTMVLPSATLQVGAQSGTYPAVPFYFQERRGYASTINEPDTYWLSQPGAYKNFDYRIPTIDSDAITGTPWAQEVNGIQFTVPMPGGLVVLTGVAAWQISGTGGAGSPITPSSQQATPQAYNGCSPLIPPLRIENYILYVQAKGSIYRLLSYNFFTNIYTGADQTIYSPQLFNGYTIVAHAYCEEPFKIIWAVRNDGVLLSNTFLPAQEINGWARHDTQGLYQSVCSVTEPPVDALYAATQRTINGQTSYMIERFDNRLWTTNENSWCVDAGLSLAQPTPAASISASATTGALLGVADLVGGQNYGAATYGVVSDVDGGPGSGATVRLTIVGGVITAVSFPAGGAAYANPQVSVNDPSGQGSGFSATCTVNDQTTLSASAAVFSAGSIGSVVRMNGGKAVITGYVNSQTVTATVLVPFVSSVLPLQAAAGAWTLTAPTTTISGLWHLAGATVTGTADGAPIPSTMVSASGSLTLATAASNIVVGLAFPVQIQSVYDQDAGGVTVQGRRKKEPAITARVELSYGFTMGTNQIDGSTLSPPQLAPPWFAMQAPTYQYAQPPYGSATPPLYTGDVRLPIQGDWESPGQIAIAQNLPLPLNVLALISDVWEADEPEQAAKPGRQGG
jgi:hypothetical protein